MRQLHWVGILRFVLFFLVWISSLHQVEGAASSLSVMTTIGERMQGVPATTMTMEGGTQVIGYWVWNQVNGNLERGGFVARTAAISGKRVSRRNIVTKWVHKLFYPDLAAHEASEDKYVLTSCYLGPEARVYGNARVSHHSRVVGAAHIYGQGIVHGFGQVYGNARVYDNAQVYAGGEVFGDAWVYGNAQVYEGGAVFGDAQVYGRAHVFSKARIYGSALLYGDAKVYNRALVFEFAKVFEAAHVWNHSQVLGEASVCGSARVNHKRVDGSIQVDGTGAIQMGPLENRAHRNPAFRNPHTAWQNDLPARLPRAEWERRPPRIPMPVLAMPLHPHHRAEANRRVPMRQMRQKKPIELRRVYPSELKSEPGEEKEQCTICMDLLDSKDKKAISELPCKHLYHFKCVEPWLLDHGTCPLCRADFAEEVQME